MFYLYEDRFLLTLKHFLKNSGRINLNNNAAIDILNYVTSNNHGLTLRFLIERSAKFDFLDIDKLYSALYSNCTGATEHI